MARIYNPAAPDGPELTKAETLAVYNALDVCITRAVYDEIAPQLTPNTQKIYDFSRALQAPVLDMVTRGVRVDPVARKQLLDYYLGKVRHYQAFLDQMAKAVWDKELNPDSPYQLQEFFYKVMGYPEVRSRKGKEMKVSTDRNALEYMAAMYIYARPIIAVILALRDAKGAVETLTRGIDPDGRYRASYNIAGTITGRWSSSKNLFGRGGNLQNVTDKLRRMFIADPGMKLAYIDLEQAESRAVGLICREMLGKDTYLKACGSGDLHSTVCMLNWPELPWTDDLKQNRKIAESPFYRELSYRDAAKKLGHGCLTEDHEVLTPNGWVAISEMPRRIACFNANAVGGEPDFEYEDVDRWTNFIHFGYMHHFKSAHIDALMTPEHRVPFRYDEHGMVQDQLAVNGPVGELLYAEYAGMFGWQERTELAVNVQHHTIGYVEGIRVFCPTVSTSYFLCRRNGKVFITGNSNYGGSPGVMAIHTKTEKPIIEEFQKKYFKAFPELPEYHRWVAQQLKETGVIVNMFGRERRFFGRPDDHKVINEAIAYGPQSLVADMLNKGLLEVYRLAADKKLPIYLLMQVHDAIVVQYPAEAEDEVIMAALGCLEAPLEGSDFWIPSDCQVGWNWAKATKAWKEGTTYKKGDKVHVPEIGFLFQAREATDSRPGTGRAWKMLEEQSNPRGIAGYKRPAKAA